MDLILYGVISNDCWNGVSVVVGNSLSFVINGGNSDASLTDKYVNVYVVSSAVSY